MSLSTNRLGDGRTAQSIAVRWAPGDSGPIGTIVARSGSAIARATVTASSGFTYYDVGSNPQTDVTGSRIVASPGGKLLYGTNGPRTCNLGYCASTQGAIGEFDPATGKSREIALPSEVLGMLFTSDGALWISGGANQLIYRMDPGPLATPAAILVPPPRKHRMKDWGAQNFAQDGSGGVWFGDGNGHRLLKIPLSGPYEESAIVAYEPPNGPVETPGARPYVGGLAYARDGNLYAADFDNGVLDRVDTATGSTIAQILLPQQRAVGTARSARPQFATATNHGVAVSLAGISAAPRRGAIDSYALGKAMQAIALPKTPAGSIPGELSYNGAYLYYADATAFGIGIVDETAGRSRLFPTRALASLQSHERSPRGVAAMSDGTAWFTCQSASPHQPLCIGHTVYLKRWSLFPGPQFRLDRGPALAQVVGIMESPARNSGPFTVRSSKPSICSVSKVVDHNFTVTGKIDGGRCTVTVTDAAGRRSSLRISVI